jgi:hypothetical protein
VKARSQPIFNPAIKTFRVAAVSLAVFWIAATPGWAGPLGSGLNSANVSSATNSFNAMQTSALASLYGSCQAQAYGGALGLAVSCFAAPPGDLKDISKSASCEAFSSGGSFSVQLADKRLSQLQELEKGIGCQKAKVEGVRGQLQCLSGQASALAAQIASLATEYQTNLTRMQGDIAQLNAQIRDRKEQDKEVLSRINGDSESGRGGLRQAKDSIERKLAEMPQILASVQRGNRSIETEKNILEEQVANRTIALTKDCFDAKTDASYRCEKNGPPVKLKDYVLCRFEQNQFIGNQDSVENSELNRARASGRREGLKQLLDEMFAESPNQKSVDLNTTTGQSSTLSFADIEKRFKKRLQGFDGKKLSISSFVLGNASACFKKAANDVKRERRMSSTEIGKAQRKIKDDEDALDAQVRKQFQDYNQAYVEALQPLTGMNFPLSLTLCERGNSKVRERCLKQIEEAIRGNLMGNTPQSEIAMSIPANKPENIINFTCRGINGCLTGLQNISTKLKQEVIKAKSFKTDYVLKANQSIEQFTQRMATALGTQNQAVKSKIDELNAALAGLGVKGTIKVDPVSAESFEKDGKPGEDDDSSMGGLYKMPKNLMDLVGGKMSPPLLDVKSSSFEDALEGIAKESDELKDRQTQITEAIDKISVLRTECLAKEEEKAQDSLKSQLSQIASCSRSVNFCATGGSDRLQELLNSINEITEVRGDRDITGPLDRGISQCSGIQKKLDKLPQERRDEVLLGENSSADCEAVVQQVESRARKVANIRKRKDKADSRSGSAI